MERADAVELIERRKNSYGYPVLICKLTDATGYKKKIRRKTFYRMERKNYFYRRDYMEKFAYVQPEIVFVELGGDAITTSGMETDAEWRWGDIYEDISD